MKTSLKGTKGLLTNDGEWMKHLRPSRKRIFWKTERTAQRKLVADEIKDK